MPKRRNRYFGSQFDTRCTKEAHGDTDVLLENFVSLSMGAGSTNFDHLMAISRSSAKPFPIKYLDPKLKEMQSSRGATYFNNLVDVMKEILVNHPSLRWWMEADGLVVDEVTPELGPLSRFDRIAGPLMIEQSRDGMLSPSSLASIAARLDAEGFDLKENLQPAQWKPIADNNRKVKKSVIKTFRAAVSDPRFVRSVRRRLYVARDRYQAARESVT